MTNSVFNQIAFDALKASQSWLERWAEHVGNCRGGVHCTCGLTAIRFDVAEAIHSAARTIEAKP